jgi:hypothetical protein
MVWMCQFEIERWKMCADDLVQFQDVFEFIATLLKAFQGL